MNLVGALLEATLLGTPVSYVQPAGTDTCSVALAEVVWTVALTEVVWTVAVTELSWTVALQDSLCGGAGQMNSYTIGTEVRLQGTFSNTSSTAANPATDPRCVITKPSGKKTTYTTGTTPAVTNTGTGIYQLQYTPAEAGIHYYYWFVPTTDNDPVAGELSFEVLNAEGYPTPSP